MLPYLTRELPGIGGVIKKRPEDFFVQELPLYEPSGEGEHVYCEIEKTGLNTFDVVARLAEGLGVAARDIGYAGMKDAKAVTRQLFSIWGTTPEKVMAFTGPQMRVLWAARHGNKLRLGHLAGNRFAIKIRQVRATDVVKFNEVMRVLEERGMPNYFGEQRFGRRGNNDLLGAALIRDDPAGLLKLLLGSPDERVDDGPLLQARRDYDAGDLALAMKRYPRHCGMERRILARLIKTGKPGAAVRAVDGKLRRLWVSALQSRLFNDVLGRRVEQIDKVWVGDLAYKHANGACFRVEDAAAEQARCTAWEISATGPLVGYRMSQPEGEALAMEEAAFAAAQFRPEDFRKAGREKVKGARRALRVRPTDVEISGGVDEHGDHVTAAFTLPAGSFATALLREGMKTEEEDSPQRTRRDTENSEGADAPDKSGG